MSELRKSIIPMLAAAAISHGEVRAEEVATERDDSEIVCIVDSINSGTKDIGYMTCALPVDGRQGNVLLEDTNWEDPYIEAPIGYKFKLPCEKEVNEVRTVFHCDMPSRYSVNTGLIMQGKEHLSELTLDDVRPLDLVIDQNGDGFVGGMEFLQASDLMDLYYNIINGEVARLEAEGVELSEEFKKDLNIFAQVMLEFGNPYYMRKYSNRDEYAAASHGVDVRSKLADLLMELYLKDPKNAGASEKIREAVDNWDSVDGEDLDAFKKYIAGILNLPMAELKLGPDNLISPVAMSAYYHSSSPLSFDLPPVETSEIVSSMLEKNGDILTFISGNEFSVQDPSIKTPRPARYVFGNDGMFHCLSFKNILPKTEEEFEAYLADIREVNARR